jgi:hypothetical protein
VFCDLQEVEDLVLRDLALQRLQLAALLELDPYLARRAARAVPRVILHSLVDLVLGGPEALPARRSPRPPGFASPHSPCGRISSRILASCSLLGRTFAGLAALLLPAFAQDIVQVPLDHRLRSLERIRLEDLVDQLAPDLGVRPLFRVRPQIVTDSLS